MPNKNAKTRKRNRLLKNDKLNKEGRTPSQILRKKRKRTRNENIR